jgi:hypothetical protein
MAERQPSHRDIHALLQELLERVGEVNEDGTTGTGLTGRIMRTEAKVLAYDRLKAQATAALATAGVFLGVIWWMIKDKVSGLFGVSAG